MDYLMTVCVGGGERSKFINPSPELIEEAIDTMLPVKYHHVIIERVKSDNGCNFLQTCMSIMSTEELRYFVEIQFAIGDPWTQYEYISTDPNEIKRMFRMFVLGVIPDASKWRDITQEIIEETANRTKKE